MLTIEAKHHSLEPIMLYLSGLFLGLKEAEELMLLT